MAARWQVLLCLEMTLSRVWLKTDALTDLVKIAKCLITVTLARLVWSALTIFGSFVCVCVCVCVCLCVCLSVCVCVSACVYV